MKTITLAEDIKVFYVTAKSFPAGIMEAHEQLHKLVPFSKERKYFGISRPESENGIVYRAATEETYSGEAEKYHCDTLILKKGNYLSLDISNYKTDEQAIQRAFDQILEQPDIDPKGYCVEWYRNDEETVTCMVKLAS